MSKMLKKVFKKVKKVVKKVTKFVKKYWKEIILVAAVVFTAGAALGYIGPGLQGGLAFGAGMGQGGLVGIQSAYGALGQTVMGAMGMQTQATSAITAKGATVQGLGTGGAFTAPTAGMTANVGGSTAAIQSANVATIAKAGAVPVAGSNTLPAVAAAGIPQTAAPAVSGLGMSTPGVAAGAAQVPAAAVPLAEGATTAGLTAGETMQLGSVGLTGYSQYAQGAAADAAEKEAEDRQAARWDWNYGDPDGIAGDPVPMSEVGYQPSEGLLQRQQEGQSNPDAAPPPSSQYQYNQPSTLDDVAAARYA
jgi:hypothetical protein